MATRAFDHLVHAVLQWTPLQVGRELWALWQDVTGGSRSHENCLVELARVAELRAALERPASEVPLRC